MKWEFWYGEYQRLVLEAGGERDFIKWLMFSQQMLEKHYKGGMEQWVREWKERELMVKEGVRVKRHEKEMREREDIGRRIGAWRSCMMVMRGGQRFQW